MGVSLTQSFTGGSESPDAALGGRKPEFAKDFAISPFPSDRERLIGNIFKPYECDYSRFFLKKQRLSNAAPPVFVSVLFPFSARASVGKKSVLAISPPLFLFPLFVWGGEGRRSERHIPKYSPPPSRGRERTTKVRRRVVSKGGKRETLSPTGSWQQKSSLSFTLQGNVHRPLQKKKIFCPRYNRFGLGSGFDTGLTYHHPPPFLSFAAAAADGDIN